MKICFLEGDMSRAGGTERMCAWLSSALSDEGYEISILSLNSVNTSVFYKINENVTHNALPQFAGKTAIYKQIKWIHNYIKSNNIDYVINVDTGIGYFGILAARGTNARTVTWEHGNYYNNWGSKIFPLIRKFAAKHSNAMVVLTNQDKENYENNIKSNVPIIVIPNLAESHDVAYDINSKTIISAGALLPIKGYDRAIEVAKKIFDVHNDWQWIICGEGPERKKLEEKIKEYGLNDKVLLPGLIDDMEKVYRSAAISIMTSTMEGLPMTLLEAKSYGIPSVSFDIMTGPRDIITHGENGYLIPKYDIDKMAETVIKLIENVSLRKQMSDNTQNDMDRFQPQYIISQWKGMLK